MAFPGDKENLGDVVCSAWGGSAACPGGGVGFRGPAVVAASRRLGQGLLSVHGVDWKRKK